MKLIQSRIAGLWQITLGLLLLFCGATSWAAVLYVDAGASGANNGSSWTNAYTDLQAALTTADWGDEIWVAAGTYKPTSGTDRDISFVMTAGVAFYGGFAGWETALTQRDWETHKTTLSGDIGAEGNDSDNSTCVVVGNQMAILDGFTVTGGNGGIRGGGMYNKNVSPTVTNCAFTANSVSNSGGGMYNFTSSPTVTNCIFSGNSASNGGGMMNSNSSPTVTNCTFRSNTVRSGGGGMRNDGSSPTVTNCIFTDNSSGRNSDGGGMYNFTSSPNVANCIFFSNSANGGGGMSNDNSSPTVTNCSFGGNSASGFGGGGMKNGDSSSTVTNCTFISNSTINDGGGMFNRASSPTVTNCTFSDNSAGIGGGMRNNFDSSPNVTNCIFNGNSANSGGGMYGSSPTVTNCIFNGNSANSGGGMYGSSGTVTNCIFWNNHNSKGFDEIYNYPGGELTFSHCTIRSSGGSGDLWVTSLGIDDGGNIAEDPLFIDTENPAGHDEIWMTADDGLALGEGSPCIDVGDTASAPETDILGKLRIGTADLGAYEYIPRHNGVVSWVLYR